VDAWLKQQSIYPEGLIIKLWLQTPVPERERKRERSFPSLNSHHHQWMPFVLWCPFTGTISLEATV
jgi:hypothetical protein